MPIYTVELDGTQYDLEGDHEPSEAEARAAIGGMEPKKATAPPKSATIGMIAPSTATSRAPSGTLMDLIPSQDQRARDMGNLIEHLPIPADVPSPVPGIVAGAKAVPGVAKAVPGVIARAAGVSRARAGANIEAALQAGRELSVPLNEGANTAAMRARDLVGSKNSELNQFLDRLTNPSVTKYRGADLAVREAQDFVSKFGAMSADDASKIPPMALKEFRTLTAELRAALTGALDTVGKGEQYARGVAEYRRSAKVAQAWENAKPVLAKWAKWAVPAGALGYGASRRD